jgi:ADP-ribose pyrophosphatase YjhB (NUDIX family)
MSYCYKHPRPALTVDCVAFAFDGREMNILLIRRASEPFKGQCALPGGFVRMDEELDAAARRELEEESGVRPVVLRQLHTFGSVDRDPRERSVSVCYFSLVSFHGQRVRPGTDASGAAWFPVLRLPKLTFDHAEMVAVAKERLQTELRRQPIGFHLLPRKFTLTDLQRLHEAVLETTFDKRNFRKKLLSFDFLVPLEETTTGRRHRPAQLFRFDRQKYQRVWKMNRPASTKLCPTWDKVSSAAML